MRFSIDTVRRGVYIFNLGYMPLIANVMYPAPPHRVRIRKDRNNLASIALQIETSGPVLLGS